MKRILYFIPLLLLLSCSNSKKDNNFSDHDKAVIKFSEFEEAEQKKQLSDSSSFVDIKLLCTEKEYNNKINFLVKDKKLKKVGRKYIYVFELMDGALVAHGELQPYFYNDMLYKLKIDCEVQGGAASLGTSVLFSKLNSLLNSKYQYPKFKDALIMESSVGIYRHGWFGDGKVIELDGHVITYSCASIEKEIYDAQQAKESSRAKEILNDM